MEFTKKMLLDIIYGGFIVDDDNKIISKEIYDKRRWTVEYELVFKYQGKFYRTYYSDGATEDCYISPFEDYSDDDIIEEVYEVHPVEKTVIVYE